MILFNKEKDLILKLTNLVLFLWLIISLALFYVAIVDILMPKPLMDYDEYSVTDCYYLKSLDEDNKEESCQESYEQYLINNREYDYLNKRKVVRFLGSSIIISGAIYLLNRNKKIKK